MASTFLKDNFKSLNEEEKKKAMITGSISDAEAELLKKSVPSDILKIKKLLEEENK